MILNLHNLSFHIILNENEIEEKIPILFLHGFTGSAKDWWFASGNLHEGFTPVFIDLLGHGNSSSPLGLEYYTFDSQVYFLCEIINLLSLKKIIILGYSMGGRLALSFGLKYPEKVLALILESTSFGIESEKEKNKRLKADKKIANRISSDSLESFIDYWLDQPLFSSLKNLSKDQLNLLKERKISDNNKIGLRNSLLSFGAGKMKYLIPEISKINYQVLLITGALDLKFCQIARLALEQIPDCRLQVVQNTGHNVHFENPGEFLKLVNDFLLNYEKNR